MADARSFLGALPIVGGPFKALFGDPAEEAKQRAMSQAIAQLQQERPELINARLNQMRTVSNAFGPMNNLMGQMFGKGAQMNIGSMIQNPFSQSYMDALNAAAHPQPQGPPMGALQANPGMASMGAVRTGMPTVDPLAGAASSGAFRGGMPLPISTSQGGGGFSTR